jgi:oligosaccharide repeat unit polymerase
VLYALSVFWYSLGEPFGPGVACGLAFGFWGLHLLLGSGRLGALDPLVWVPVSILMFYFGTPVVIEWLRLPVLGGYGSNFEVSNDLILKRGYCVALFALVSLLWGIHLCGIRRLEREPWRNERRDHSLGPAALLFALGSLGMVVFGIALVGPSTVFGLYQDWWDAKLLGGADERFIDIGTIFSFAGVFALLATDEPGARWRRYLAYAAAVGIAVVTIQKGDRSSLVALCVGAGWVYSQRVGRLRWPTVVAAAMVGLLLMPVIGEWRSWRRLDQSKQDTVVDLLGRSLGNMGSAVNSIIFTVELIPSTRGYYWGGTFRHALVSAIPNVGLTRGLDFKRGSMDDSPSHWLTSVINPTWYANRGGHGFSMAAEWYYNFGFPGMWIGMALCGWTLALLRNSANRSSLALVWSATLFAAMAIWVRNVVAVPIKIALWPVIGLWVIDQLVRLLRGRASRPRVQVADGLPGEEPHARVGS